MEYLMWLMVVLYAFPQILNLLVGWMGGGVV